MKDYLIAVLIAALTSSVVVIAYSFYRRSLPDETGPPEQCSKPIYLCKNEDKARLERISIECMTNSTSSADSCVHFTKRLLCEISNCSTRTRWVREE